MDDICASCLCKGRKLCSLETTGFGELFSEIFNEIQFTQKRISFIHICWECKAKLKNWHKFRNQAQSSYRLFLQHCEETPYTSLSNTPNSTLSIQSVFVFDCKDLPLDSVKVEPVPNDGDVKREVDYSDDDIVYGEPVVIANEMSLRKPKRKLEEKPSKNSKKKIKIEKSKIAPKKRLSKYEMRRKRSPSPEADEVDAGDDMSDDHDDVKEEDVENRVPGKGLHVIDDTKINKLTTTMVPNIPNSRLSIQNVFIRESSDLSLDYIKIEHVAKDGEVKREVDALANETDLYDSSAFTNDLSEVSSKKKNGKEKSSKKPNKKVKLEKSKTTTKKKIDNTTSPVEDICDNMVDDDVTGGDVPKKDLDDLETEKSLEENDVKRVENGDKTRKPMNEDKSPKKKMFGDKPQCLECGKMFSSKKTFRYHWNVLHKGQNRYPCPRCGKVYQWKSNLGRHLRSHKARDSGELYCEACDKRFASVATYKQHLRVSRQHVSESDFNFMCNECGMKFVSKTRLRDHIDWEHLKKIKFKCQLCHKPFKCHTSLYVHMQNVHANKEKDLCHVCGKAYQSAAKLRYHIVAMHTGETPYQCAQCRVSFGWYSSLYRHVREVHYKMKLQPKKGNKKPK